jgi:MacB-like periplasmic core domain/FtsX-like permease family
VSRALLEQGILAFVGGALGLWVAWDAMGIPILRGRPFNDTERDPGRPVPALISEPTAARLWPGLDPLGRRFTRTLPGERSFEVVGVVADARTTSIEDRPPFMVYVPYWWRTRTATSLVVKTSADPTALLTAIRRAVHDVDPEIAIGQTRTVEQLVDRAMAGRRYQAQLFVAFGFVALAIATLGTYAVTSQGLVRRRREMNIRVALGAPAARVRAMILRESGRPLLLGRPPGSSVPWPLAMWCPASSSRSGRAIRPSSPPSRPWSWSSAWRRRSWRSGEASRSTRRRRFVKTERRDRKDRKVWFSLRLWRPLRCHASC